MSPTARVRIAWVMLVICTIAWPLTAFTVARDEPPFILGLSWFAIIITAFDLIVSSDVRKQQDEGSD